MLGICLRALDVHVDDVQAAVILERFDTDHNGALHHVLTRKGSATRRS